MSPTLLYVAYNAREEHIIHLARAKCVGVGAMSTLLKIATYKHKGGYHWIPKVECPHSASKICRKYSIKIAWVERAQSTNFWNKFEAQWSHLFKAWC